MLHTNVRRGDEELISKISGGSALHGLRFGISGTVPSELAPLPVIKIPHCTQLMKPSLPTQIRSVYFKTSEEGSAFSKAITENGYSFGFDLKVKRFGFGASVNFERKKNEEVTKTDSSEQKSTNIAMFNFHFYPMGSYLFDGKELELSANAVKSLRDVKDISLAEKFLIGYGSHVPGDLQHVGGILIHSVEVSTTEQRSNSSLERIATDEMKVAASLGYGVFNAGGNYTSTNKRQEEFRSFSQSSNVRCRFQFDIRGPNNTDPKKFEELLRQDNSSWHIIDRGNIFESMIPIWNIVYEKHSELKNQADLLRNAWLSKSSSCRFDIVKQERLKVEYLKKIAPASKEQQTHTEELRKQIDLLGAVNLNEIGQGELMELLQKFYSLITQLEFSSSGADQPSANDPWVNYVAKQPEIRRLLMQLADKEEEYKNKLSSVYSYLRSIINADRRQKMEHAYYKLDDKICAMLARGESSSLPPQQRTAGINSGNIPNANVANLADVLSVQLQQHGGNMEELQKRIEAILCKFFTQTDQSGGLREEIFDLLLSDYYWSEGKFEHALRIDEFEALVKEILKLQQEKTNEFKYIKYPKVKQSIRMMDDVRGSKKHYADILIDRPLNIVNNTFFMQFNE